MNFILNADAATPWQLGFQDPATPWMEGIIALHHHIFFVMIIIVAVVSYLLFRIVFLGVAPILDTSKKESLLLEVVWTLTPSLILFTIAIPSFALLYATDEAIEPSVTLKVIGRQWYWSYEYSDYQIDESSGDTLTFDSYMVNEEDLEIGDLRLLEVDNPVVLPAQTHINVIVTSSDVLHSWSVPSLGLKIDAVPGRLNQVSLFIKREGVFYGQCSEICGVNHGFMPIVVKAVSLSDYVSWVSDNI